MQWGVRNDYVSRKTLPKVPMSAPATHHSKAPGAATLLDEARRLEVLRRFAVLDFPPDGVLDRITRMAALSLQTPMATITFVDETRQWFKWRFGLETPESGRDISFCNDTILRREVSVVPDAWKDPRFARNPLVRGKPNIRFYAGAPLVTSEGAAIGTIVVLDTRPRRRLDAREREILAALADLAIQELEMRLAAGDVHAEISQRIAACEARERGEAIFRQALSGSQVGVFTLDRELRYAWVFNRVCGRPAEELRGRRNAEAFAPEDAAFMDMLAGEVLQTGCGTHVRIRCRAPTGAQLLHVDYRLEPMAGAGGRVDGVVGVAIDVSEETRLKREAALARAKIEAAARSKNQFLAAASHDLRQPFQAMRLFADVLAQRLDDPGQLAILTRLNEAMRAGEGLLGSLLELSVLEAGTLRPSPASLPVQAITLPLVEEFAPQAAEKGLRLRHCVPRAVIVTDPTLFPRMLWHLMANAVRYTAAGKILLGGRIRRDTLQLQLWDTGIGIPGRELQAVFEPFYQLGNPERDRNKGLGLGLAIVEKTARLLGHSLGVRSQAGVGTVFTISVPVEHRKP